MPQHIAPQRGSRGQIIGTGQTAVEENPAERVRKVTAAWNTRYFAYLKVGTGLGGAAAIEKYKTANPGWEKARDTWAQGMVRAAKKPKAGPTLGDLVK